MTFGTNPARLNIVGMIIALYAVAASMFVIGYLDFANTSFVPEAAWIMGVMFTVILPAFLIISRWRKIALLCFIVLLNIASWIVLYFYTGSYNPFTALWALVAVLSYYYYGYIGFWISVLGFVVVSYLWILQPSLGLGESLLPMLAFTGVLATIITGTAFVFVRMLSEAKKKNELLEEAKKAEEDQYNKLEALLNSIDDAVLTINRYGRITTENAAALSFFDTNESLIGKRVDDAIALNDKLGNQISIKKMMEAIAKSISRDDLSLKKDDETRYINLRLAPIHGLGMFTQDSGVVLTLQDITERRQLDDEKDEFISVTSHELRTPVTIAEGSLSNLVLMQKNGTDTKILESAAELAHSQVVELAGMINDLSTLSRAERGKGDALGPVNIEELFHNMYLKYLPKAKVKDLKLNLDVESGLPVVTTSQLYVQEILQNLITNAIKYTTEGSITLSAKRIGNDTVECSVSDTGIGISKEDQKKLFSKFFRSEDYRTRVTSGTGLGLYVIAKLAHKLGTKIDFKSRLNHGTTFSFKLSASSKFKK